MKIDWTPWINVSMHRRLEVLGVAFLIFCAYFVGSISSITIIHSLVIQFRFMIFRGHLKLLFDVIIFRYILCVWDVFSSVFIFITDVWGCVLESRVPCVCSVHML